MIYLEIFRTGPGTLEVPCVTLFSFRFCNLNLIVYSVGLDPPG